MNKAQIMEFQRNNLDWSGKPLDVDGSIGPRTEWAMAIVDFPAFRRNILQHACFYIGVQETSTNRGKLIDEWLLAVGAGVGLPWCAAFASAILRAAGVDFQGSASAAGLLGQFKETAYPYPGDLFGWINSDISGHVGFVLGYTKEGIATVEGNSANCVRICSRPYAGLEFRTVPFQTYRAQVSDAIVVQRQTDGTR